MFIYGILCILICIMVWLAMIVTIPKFIIIALIAVAVAVGIWFYCIYKKVDNEIEEEKRRLEEAEKRYNG